MKYLFLFSSLVTSIVFGQVIEQTPINPEFLEYLKNKEIGQLKTTTNGYQTGVIPAPFSFNFTKTSLKSIITDDIPSSYDLRLINDGAYLTSVKAQGNSGTCWAFATYSAVESYFLKQGLGTFNFSEQNLATCHGFDLGANDGGNSYFSTAYFSRHAGPINETDDPYTQPDNNSSCTSDVTPELLIDQARYLPGLKYSAYSADVVKSSILNYGGLYIHMHYSSDHYNNSDYSFYYNGSVSINHAVVLIGWDDDMVIAGNSLCTPTNPGAWIAKNSWGSNWGDNGYFYISYEDTKALSSIAYYPSSLNSDSNIKTYYYDQCGMISATGFNANTAYGLAMYSSEEVEQLNKVGLFIKSSNSNVDIKIYDSFNDSTLNDYLGGIKDTTCELPGYYTFQLDSSILLNWGNDFYIKVKITTPNYRYPLPIEYKINGYSSTTSIEEGKCWISDTGTNWVQIGAETAYEYDLCIKAYTTVVENTLAANFDADIYTGETPLTVQFTDLSEGNPTAWQWDFNNDNIIDSNEQNPTYTYTQDSTYSVSVAISNNTHSDTLTIIDFITVTQPITSYNLSSEYTFDFELEEDRNKWTIINANEDDRNWAYYEGYGIDGSSCAAYLQSANQVANDWLNTPVFNLSSEEQYQLDFYTKVELTSSPEKLAVYLIPTDEVSNTDNELIIDLHELTDEEFTLSSAIFSPTANTLYKIGFYCYSDTSQYYLYLDEVSLKKATSTSLLNTSNEVKLYPNPTYGIVNLELYNLNTKPKTVNVINIIGNNLLNLSVDNRNILEIDLSAFDNSIYLIELVYINGSKVYKIYKK